MLSFAVASLAGFAEHAPTFMWSPHDHGMGRNAQHLHEASALDLERTVSAMQGHSGVASPLFPVGERTAPEVHLVFLAPGLATESVREHGAGLTAVEHLLTTSASSLSVPFTTASAELPRLFESATRVAGHAAEEYVAAHPELFTNGSPDTLVVELAAMTAGQKGLADLDSLVVTAAGSNPRPSAFTSGSPPLRPVCCQKAERSHPCCDRAASARPSRTARQATTWACSRVI